MCVCVCVCICVCSLIISDRTCSMSAGSDITSKESLINTTKLSQSSKNSGPQGSSSESVYESDFSPQAKSGPKSERDEELADSMVDPDHCVAARNDDTRLDTSTD